MKVFLVEDTPEILNRLHSLISEIGGVEVVAQADSEEPAVAGIFAARPDAVILDMVLASGSGIHVLRRVKAQRPEIPVIVLTNHCYPQYRDRCRLLGAEHFLDKAKDFKKLGGLLAEMAAGQKGAKADE